jgi:hypothetical protein
MPNQKNGRKRPTPVPIAAPADHHHYQRRDPAAEYESTRRHVYASTLEFQRKPRGCFTATEQAVECRERADAFILQDVAGSILGLLDLTQPLQRRVARR